jgi:hypothetical protein
LPTPIFPDHFAAEGHVAYAPGIEGVDAGLEHFISILEEEPLVRKLKLSETGAHQEVSWLARITLPKFTPHTSDSGLYTPRLSEVKFWQFYFCGLQGEKHRHSRTG